MAPAPYYDDNPIPEDDRDTPYPYQDFYGGGRKKPRRIGGHGGWWILLVLVVLVIGAVGFFSRFSVDVRQTAEGVTLSIQNTASDGGDSAASAVSETQETPAAAVLRPSAESTDSGTELTVAAAPADIPATYASSGQGLSFQEIYAKAIPSVVSITTTLYNGVSTGTGIVMSEDGYIITNEHVIDGAVAIEVLTSADATYSASLVGSDATSDLAVLKIEAADLTAAEFGDSDAMEVGDAVLAIGDPLGAELRGTMTDGIISAINRDLVVNGRSMTLLQTNAALNNGNSGGPLLNVYGQVIGINTMKMSSYYTASATIEGLGFAIPVATAKPIIDELIAQGYVTGRPAIGISAKDLPDAVRAYYRIPAGVYIGSVNPASDAYAQGIREGDTITAIEGVAISNTDELNVIKNQFEAGDTVRLTIYRGGELYNVEVVLSDASGM